MNTAAKRLIFVGFIATLSGMPAFGQDTGESCAAIGDDTQRLACYDGVFRSGAELPAGGLTFNSERTIPARPTGREPATFALACVTGQSQVSFRFAGQPVSATGDIAPITLQVDQGQTLVRTLNASADNTVLSFSNPRETAAFLDSLNGGTTLKVRVTPVGQRSFTVNFRLTEAIAEIKSLRDSCR